jgi:hypothetical protein
LPPTSTDTDTPSGLVDLGDLGADAELDATLLESLLGGLGDLGVLDRHDPVDGLDHGHLGAQGAVEAGEFDADGARADHDQRLGHGLRRQGVAIGPDLVAVRHRADGRDVAGAGAAGQDDVLGLDGAAAAGLQGDDDLRSRRALLELSLAFDDLDLVLLHQEGDAARHGLGHAARALDDLVEVERRLLDRQAVAIQVRQLLEDLAGLQQGLGGDAAPVQADAAKVLALDDRRLQTQLAGADRGHIAARTGADDDDIEFRGHGVLTLAWTSPEGSRAA